MKRQIVFKIYNAFLILITCCLIIGCAESEDNNLYSPSGESAAPTEITTYTIPTANIVVDGCDLDWASIANYSPDYSS